MKDFTIPLDKEELLNSHFGQLSIQEIIPINRIGKEINAINQNELSAKLPEEIVQSKFELFFSVVVHGNKLELVLLFRTFTKILKLVKLAIDNFEKKLERNCEMNEYERNTMLNSFKMLAYLLSTILCIIEDEISSYSNNNIENVGKRKKNLSKSEIEEEWEGYKEQSVETIYRWLQLPLKDLWNPPIVEDSFVGALSQVCYKILEKAKDFKSKLVKTHLFQVLGLLVKKFNHGIAFVVRIIHLVKFNEALALPLGAGVVIMSTECGCTGLIKEIVREIIKCEPGEADARSFSTFLEAIAMSRADSILPILENIQEFLDSDCYVLRNCAVSVIGIVVSQTLTEENLVLEKKVMRDDCLNNLKDHILDNNAYVRSKILQIWQRLICEGAVPLSRQINLLEAAVLRLEDKSANVRKQALQLLKAILQSNPFTSQINQEEFVLKLEQAKAELKHLQANVYHIFGSEEEKEELWQAQVPLIENAIDQIHPNLEIIQDADLSVSNECELDINYKEAYNTIQNLILHDKCYEAIEYLKNLFLKSGLIEDLENLSEELKKEALLLFLYKIFMYSSRNDDVPSNRSQRLTIHDVKCLDKIKVKKNLIKYLENCLKFSQDLVKCLPIVENLLYSSCPGDSIEACCFLGTAFQFQVPGALSGIRRAIFQIFCRDQSVRDNLVSVYKEVYLSDTNEELSSRQKALTSIKALIGLLGGIHPGQSPALALLITSWINNNELNSKTLKVMWEFFSMKIPNTSYNESRSALMLLTMASQEKPSIIIENLDVLIKVGFGPRAEKDLLLARDTCRAFLNIKQNYLKNINKAPIKFSNDHEIFQHLSSLLKEKIFASFENGFYSFAVDAVNVIFLLADQPDSIVEEILCHIARSSNLFHRDADLIKLTDIFSSRLMCLVGHIAIKKMVHLDQFIYKELKRRNAVREKKKENQSKNINFKNRESIFNKSSISIPSSANRSKRNKEMSYRKVEEEQEEGLDGAVADDIDAEHISVCLENEILSSNSYLNKFVSLIVHVCQHPDIYVTELVQGHAVIALCKLMTISSTFCESNMQLLITILEKSVYPHIRANALTALSDLMTRFPNQIEPWTSHIYGRLKDQNIEVRSTCIRILSNLILGEMIRVKGQVSQLALCLVDDNEAISSEAKQLFHDLAKKGNALYNVIPDILSCLSDSELNLQETEFQKIIKYILGLLQKERQVDNIIEKLCSRFKLASTERQWRDLSYCLSLLKFSAKSIRCLIKDLPSLKDKIHNDYVLKTLFNINEQTKRKPEAKEVCLELEERIKELLDCSERFEDNLKRSSDYKIMPPPIKIPKPGKRNIKRQPKV